MGYPGQPFQRGKRRAVYQSPLSKPRSPAKERAICMTRGQRYSTEDAARAALADLERTKINPGALKVFACGHCDGFHLGTAFGPNPRVRKPVKSRRRPRAAE